MPGCWCGRELYKFEVAYADYRVAYRHELFLQPVYVGEGGHLFQVDYEKFGAVSKLNFAEVEVDYIRVVAEFRFLFGFDRLGRDVGAHFFAREGSEEAAHYGH